MKKFESLHSIATESLRACYVEDKVVASPTHFSDFWARDTFWSVPGMMVAGDYETVKESLRFFLVHQRADGKIPRKISRDINVVKYLGGKSIQRKKPRPTYHGLVKPFSAMDSELLMVIACGHYLEETRDYDFAETYYRAIQKALHNHTEKLTEGFIHEYFLGNWMDTVFKFGPVLYTNVLYARALEAMVLIAQVAGNDDEAEVYVHRARGMKRRLQKHFWNGQFFSDELRLQKLYSADARVKHDRKRIFTLAGNVMACVYDIAHEEQQREVVAHIVKAIEEHGAWLGAVPNGQRFWKINPLVRALGIGDYHTQTSWLWIIVLMVRLLDKHGEHTHAQKILTAIAAVAVRDGEIGETYTHDGMPYKKLLWRSASPFAWSSAMTLETLKECGHIDNAVDYPKPEPRIC